MGLPQKQNKKEDVPKVPQKEKRNARERRRVNQVNEGFDRLRTIIPAQPGQKPKNTSKAQVLRDAVTRINELLAILQSTPGTSTSGEVDTPQQSPCYSQSTNSYNNISPYYPPTGVYQHQQMMQQHQKMAENRPSPDMYYSDGSYEEHQQYNMQ